MPTIAMTHKHMHMHCVGPQLTCALPTACLSQRTPAHTEHKSLHMLLA